MFILELKERNKQKREENQKQHEQDDDELHVYKGLSQSEKNLWEGLLILQGVWECR